LSDTAKEGDLGRQWNQSSSRGSGINPPPTAETRTSQSSFDRQSEAIFREVFASSSALRRPIRVRIQWIFNERIPPSLSQLQLPPDMSIFIQAISNESIALDLFDSHSALSAIRRDFHILRHRCNRVRSLPIARFIVSACSRFLPMPFNQQQLQIVLLGMQADRQFVKCPNRSSCITFSVVFQNRKMGIESPTITCVA
jgi:hypothetical protein